MIIRVYLSNKTGEEIYVLSVQDYKTKLWVSNYLTKLQYNALVKVVKVQKCY